MVLRLSAPSRLGFRGATLTALSERFLTSPPAPELRESFNIDVSALN